MTATEILRRLLDERGVEWHISNEKGATFWTGQFGIGYYARQNDDGETLHMLGVDLTPKQAIATTLGRGTCHITDNGPWGYPYVCSACGASFDSDVNNGEFNYCPNCGHRIVEPTTNDVDAEVDS